VAVALAAYRGLVITPKSLIASLGVTAMFLTSAGCVANADAFAKRAAKFSCIQTEECADEFGYDSQSDCRDEVEDAIKESNKLAEDAGCEYVAKEGRACIKEARKNKKECGESAQSDVADACMDVWDCPDAGASELEQADEEVVQEYAYSEEQLEEILPESMMIDALLRQ